MSNATAIRFKNKDDQGWRVYEATLANGHTYRISPPAYGRNSRWQTARLREDGTIDSDARIQFADRLRDAKEALRTKNHLIERNRVIRARIDAERNAAARALNLLRRLGIRAKRETDGMFTSNTRLTLTVEQVLTALEGSTT